MLGGHTWTPPVAKLSFSNGLKVKIAPVHSDFHYETYSLSLMGSAGQRLNRLRITPSPRAEQVIPPVDVRVWSVIMAALNNGCFIWLRLKYFMSSGGLKRLFQLSDQCLSYTFRTCWVLACYQRAVFDDEWSPIRAFLVMPTQALEFILD